MPPQVHYLASVLQRTDCYQGNPLPMEKSQEVAEFAARFNEICDDMNVPPIYQGRQVFVAKEFGVSQKGARKWLKAVGQPKLETIMRIATWGNVKTEWLLTGKGEKFVATYLSPQEKAFLDSFRALDSEGKARVLRAALRMRNLKK